MPKNGKRVLDYLRGKMSVDPSRVKTIVLTHCHIPYVRGAYEIRKATGARIAIHDHDAEYLSRKKKMPPPKGPVGLLFRISAPFLTFPRTEPDLKLKENDSVGDSLTVIHTPGHTPGSISLYDQRRKMIFVADTIRYVGEKLQGPPEEFTFDMNEARNSVEKISRLDFDTILGGQGEAFKSDDAPEKLKELAASML